MRVLAGHGDHPAHVLLAIVAQIAAAEDDAPGFRVEEAEEHVRHGRLSGAARSEQGDLPARVEPEVEAVERRRLARRVPRADAFEREPELGGCGRRLGRVDDGRLAVGQLEDPAAGRDRRAELCAPPA